MSMHRYLALCLLVALGIGSATEALARRKSRRASKSPAIRFCAAIEKDRFAALQKLLERDPELAGGSCQDTPVVLFAVQHGAGLVTIAELLRRGAEANAPGRGGDTALHLAARTEDIELAKLLMQFGGDPSVQNAVGISVEHEARRRNRSALLRALLLPDDGSADSTGPAPDLRPEAAPLGARDGEDAGVVDEDGGGRGEDASAVVIDTGLERALAAAQREVEASLRQPEPDPGPAVDHARRAGREAQQYLRVREAADRAQRNMYILVALVLLVVGSALVVPKIRRWYWRRQLEQQPGADSYRERMTRSGTFSQVGVGSVDDSAQIARQDTDFDQLRLIERVKKAHATLSQAVSDHRPGAVRGFVSDGLYERTLLQVEEQAAHGYRVEVREQVLYSARAVHIEAGTLYDLVHINLEGSASFTRVALDSGAPLDKPAKPERFSEVWSLMRRRGARDLGDQPGTLENCCPGCGASTAEASTTTCAYCGARLLDAEHDWMLCEITQRSEWLSERSTELPGVEALVEKDPEFSVQHVEDRAALMFWRRTRADRRAEADLIRRVAHPDLVEQYRALLVRMAKGSQGLCYYTHCEIGSIRTLGVLDEGDWIKVLVEVAWSGWRMRVRGQAEPERDSDHTTFTKNLYVLGRRAGSHSQRGQALLSSHCPSCGAPEQGGASGQCEHCDTVLNDGSRDWILLEMPSWTTPEAVALIKAVQQVGKSSADQKSGQAMLGWLARGFVDVDEIDLGIFVELARRFELDEPDLQRAFAEAQAGATRPPPPANAVEAMHWFTALLELASQQPESATRLAVVIAVVGKQIGYTVIDLRRLLHQSVPDPALRDQIEAVFLKALQG